MKFPVRPRLSLFLRAGAWGAMSFGGVLHGPRLASAGELKGTFAFEGFPPKAAFVSFTDDHSWKPGDALVVDQKDKSFVSAMFVGKTDGDMVFKNSDAVRHNVYVNNPALKIDIDTGLADPGTEIRKKVVWPAGEMVSVNCKIHTEMKAVIVATDSAYHTIVEFERKKRLEAPFTLAGVSASVKQVRAVFSDNSPPVEIELKPGESKTVDLIKGEEKKSRGSLTLSRS